MILNLDKYVTRPYRTLNVTSFKHFTFSGNETHIKFVFDLEKIKDLTITHRILSFNDIGLLRLVVNALRYMGIKTQYVFLPYFPVTKQDKVMVTGEPLSVKLGKLSDFKVYAEALQGNDCLIEDDICDDEGRFLGLAKKLKNKKVENLYLTIRHGIFSKGLETLRNTFSKLFTTDSFKTNNGEIAYKHD